MGDDGINKAREEHRIHQVGFHLGAFRNSSCHNAGESTGKGKLEEPTFEANVLVVLEEESAVSDKGLGGAVVVATVGKSVSDGPKSNASTARVDYKLNDNLVYSVS